MTKLLYKEGEMASAASSSRIAPEEVFSTLRKYMLVDGIDLVIDIQKSQGPYFYDVRNKRKYLDMFSFVASNPVGMNHPKMTHPDFIAHIGKAALNKPSLSDIYCEEMAVFVDTFFRIAVPPYFKYSFFIEGGAAAVENALKTAFDWKVRKNFKKGYKTEKGHKVIHLLKAFHGRSGYTMSLTNTEPVKTALYPKFDWPRITNPAAKFPLNEDNIEQVIKLENRAVDEIKKALADNKDDIACLIMEPIQGEGGDNHFRKEFFEKARELCDENEMLFIIDEIQTGVGMTGKWWAHQHFIQPDIIAFGKKTQVCGILVSDRIDDIPDNVFHTSSRLNSTWGGSLTDMMRFTKYLEIIDEEGLVENARIVGEHLLGRLQELASKYKGLVSNARGKGLFCAIDLPDGNTRTALKNRVFEKGVVILGSGEKSIRFRPPLNIRREEIDQAVEVIESSLKEL